MFNKISRAAEKAAAGVGRREFLGRVGRGAAVIAGAIGGVLATARDAEAFGGLCCAIGLGCCKGKCPKGSGGTTIRCPEYGYCPRC
jgi:hypothetical protein